MLFKKNISCGVINGEVAISVRQKLQKDFQEKILSVMCMQLQTGKFGLNLSSASTAIYFSNSLNPDDRSQSEARIEHNLKKEPLLYIDLVSKNSIDEEILKTLKMKHRQSKFFLGQIVDQLKGKYD